MKDNKMIKKQLFKNMIYNFFAFTIIFGVFAIILFSTIEGFIYRSTNEELLNYKNKHTELITRPAKVYSNTALKKEYSAAEVQDVDSLDSVELEEVVYNPRIINIQRNEAGEIVNRFSLGNFYDYYLKDIKLDKSNLDKLYDITIDREFTYRAINFRNIVNGEVRYYQLLINIDAEKEMLDSFFNILSVGYIIAIILSIVASYILSKNTIKPIADALKKQTEFVENASHELRTPLAIIQAKQELLLKEPNAKILDKSEEISLTLNETRRLAKLTKDLMILARGDSDGLNINKTEIRIDKLIKEIAKPYVEVAKLENKNLTLNLNYENKIEIDKEKIHQVLVILLDNSIKYTKSKDKIIINLYGKDNKVYIEVVDTGIGISSIGKKHVFERFYRDDKARNRKTGGYGLGLSIADLIVLELGGKISVDDNEPKGTKFIIKLTK